MATKTRKVTVSTRDYEAAHGHPPYSTQHGGWAFLVGRERIWLGGVYRLCLREARRRAQAAGAQCVRILP